MSEITQLCDRLMEAHGKATAGKWYPIGDCLKREYGSYNETFGKCTTIEIMYQMRPDDAAFIAAAHNDLPSLVAEVRRLTETCEWDQEDRDGRTWHCTVCGAAWTFEVDGPKENDMKFCPECGRRIVKCNEWQDEDAEQEATDGQA